jgi:hypothetical protein
MSVRVEHRSANFEAKVAKTTDFGSSSWTVQDGHLIIGDSFGNPEATFAPGQWFSVNKAEDSEEDSDS